MTSSLACDAAGGQTIQSAVREEQIVLRSPAMLEIARVVERVAPRRIPVLVLGETGTGKELIAQELHRRSERRHAPLQVVNCGAIPQNLVESVLFGHARGAFTGADRAHKGVFEQGHGGTVFLDEIGELSPSAQAVLLRVLDTRRICPVGDTQEVDVDVRIVAATHRDLSAMVEQGSFRLDLLHRLNALTLNLPPLRERLEEVMPLAELFASRCAGQWERPVPLFAPDAMERLLAYHWPGNVRELRNVIERAFALDPGELITVLELPPQVRGDGPGVCKAGLPSSPPHASFPEEGLDLRALVEGHEAALIKLALERANGHQRTAAKLLKLPLRTFERKLRKFSGRPATFEYEQRH